MVDLTQEELLHLAIEATRREEHGASISYLKEGVSRFPNDPKLAYVLGAEFAQIGMYDQAEEEMLRAIKLDPSLYTASFQLGLLQMTLGKNEQAVQNWKNIDNLPHDNPLWLFKTGLECLAKNQNQDAIQHIQQGLSVNHLIPELNKDMEMVLNSIKNENSNNQAMTPNASAGQAWLKAYGSDTE